MDNTSSVLILDASADLAGGNVTYEDKPNGCGAAQLTVGLVYEDVIARGYYTARNLVEISSGDDTVQTAISAGATKIYVGSKGGYDTGVGQDQGQIALFDGTTLCMRIPVTGVGTDGGGDYITVTAPLPGGSNFSTIPAYGPGTLIYRRRYCGIIMGRQLQSQRDPITIINCAGMSQRLAEAVGTFALTTSTVDMGTAIFNLLNDFASPNWPEFIIDISHFSVTGQTNFNSSYQSTQVSRIVSDLLAAANSNGNMWVLRVGHDRIPRMIRLYTAAGNTYTYNVTLQQGVTYFEARTFVNSDQDASQLYNVIEVIGDTDPNTQQTVNAIVRDATSITFYGEIDAQPVTNTACKTVAQCALYGQSLLNQQAAPRSNAQVTVATRNDVFVPSAPMGLSRGDVVLGLHNVTVTEIAPAPNVYGLVTSVVTTVEPAGDTYQFVRFSAIEPDWSDDVAERANALASAIRQNTTTAVSVASYMISVGAFNVAYIGLVVTTPTFAAIFAQGSSPVACGGNSFTLIAMTTNWAWLNPDATWTIKQDPSPVTSALLYAIYTTNATTIVGIINKASTGMIYVPVSALPSMGNQAAPVLTNVSAVSYPVIGNGTYDAQVSFTVDVPSATWLVGLALFAIAAGSTVDPHMFPKGTISSFGDVAGEYVAIWKGIGAGNAEDLYVSYEDGQGRFSGARFVATTTANPAGSSAFGPVGTTAPNPTASASAFVYYSAGASTFDAACNITLDANGTISNNNLAEIETVIAAHSRGLTSSSANGWVPTGTALQKNTTGIYVVDAGGLGAGTAYDVGVRYVGHTGDRSYVYIVGTTAANPQFISNLPGMPAGQAGPTITNVSPITYPVVGNGTFDAVVTFTVDVTLASWLTGITLWRSTPQNTTWQLCGFMGVGESNFGTYVATWLGQGSSNAQIYFLAISYEDGRGVSSPITFVGQTIPNPAGSSAFGAVGTAPPNPVQPATGFVYQHNGGGTYDADFTVYLDQNGTAANNNLAEIEVVVAPSTRALGPTSGGWTPVGTEIAKNATGVYTCTAGGMGVQVPYTVGVRYVGHTGDRSYVYIVGITSAAQMAQLPFAGATVDPATGYIVILDQAIYPTTLQYALPSAGIGSMISAAWSASSSSTSVTPTIWIMGNGAASAPSSGYLLEWVGTALEIVKWNGSTYSILASSTASFTKTGSFVNMAFIAAMATAGTVNLTGIINGQIAVQCADSSAPYISGWIGAQFRDASATNFIDDKTVAINIGGSPSSSGFKAQANIIPASVPGCVVGVSSPTNTGLFLGHGLANHGGLLVTIQGGNLIFSDGTNIPFPAVTLLQTGQHGGGADGLWYFSVAMIPARQAGIYYLAQTAPTSAQLSQFYADGVIPIAFNQSFTVVPAGAQVYGLNTTTRRLL